MALFWKEIWMWSPGQYIFYVMTDDEAEAPIL